MEDRSGKLLPLLLALHGGGMTSLTMASVTRLSGRADKKRFIAAYFQGLDSHWDLRLR